jgi:hypothetical protein
MYSCCGISVLFCGVWYVDSSQQSIDWLINDLVGCWLVGNVMVTVYSYVGIAVENYGTGKILRTVDGGQSWEKAWELGSGYYFERVNCHPYPRPYAICQRHPMTYSSHLYYPSYSYYHMCIGAYRGFIYHSNIWSWRCSDWK